MNQSGVPKTQRAPLAPRGQTRGKEDKTAGDARPMPVMAKIMQPTLDDKHRFLLDGKNDKVKGLVSIQVTFYPGGLQEITYAVDETGNGDIQMMSTSAFMSYTSSVKRAVAQEGEVKASKGFVAKLMKRTFIMLSDDSVEKVRQVQSMELPKPAEKMMSLTQEQFKQRGFGDEGTMLKHWNNMPETIVNAMNEFQFNVEPSSAKWSDRLKQQSDDFVTREKAAAEKKARKALLRASPEQDSGGGSKMPTSVLAKGSQWGEDGESEEETPPTQKVGTGTSGVRPAVREPGKDAAEQAAQAAKYPKPPPIPVKGQGGGTNVGSLDPPSVKGGGQAPKG